MVMDSKAIATEFMTKIAEQRAVLDSTNDDDIDEFGVSEEVLQELFDKLKTTMGEESKLGFFRDNDADYGRYDEYGDFVLCPLCIYYYPEKEIVKHLMHELYHAFHYCAICEPERYSCFDDETIKTWRFEYEHYISGAIDMQQYLGQ